MLVAMWWRSTAHVSNLSNFPQTGVTGFMWDLDFHSVGLIKDTGESVGARRTTHPRQTIVRVRSCQTKTKPQVPQRTQPLSPQLLRSVVATLLDAKDKGRWGLMPNPALDH
jgi:hypothetical protein